MIGQQKYIKVFICGTYTMPYFIVICFVGRFMNYKFALYSGVAELTISADRSAFIWPVHTVSVRSMLKSMKPLFISTGLHHSFPYTTNTMDNIVILTTNMDHVKGLSALLVLNVSNTVDTRRHSNL